MCQETPPQTDFRFLPVNAFHCDSSCDSRLQSKEMSIIVKAPGLEAKIADALRDELMPRSSIPQEQPFYRLPSTPNTEKTLNGYIEVYSQLVQ